MKSPTLSQNESLQNNQWHEHNGKDAPKVKPENLAPWNLSSTPPASSPPIPNGQWKAFMPADIGIYTRATGWNVISFVNAYVQKTTGNASVGALATVQVFTGSPIADSQDEMPAGTFTAKFDGWYQVTATVRTDIDSTLVMRKNGSPYAQSRGTGSLTISRMVQLAVGDTLTFFATNNDTVSTMTLSGTILNAELDIYKIANVNS